jgi:hypothetical protein
MNKKTDKKKVLLIVIIAIALLLIAVSFVTSTTYTQLAISSLLYPPLAYFAFKSFPNKGRKKDAQRLVVKVKSESEPRKEPVEIVDIDKRAFLKMIGAAGFSFFIFSLFTRRVESLIFNRTYGAGNNPFGNPSGDRDTSPTEPTEGYRVTEISTEEYDYYYGFVNKDGKWYIMREDPTEGSFRYVKGDLNFSNGWKRREKLKYDYYHNVFN